MLKKYNDSKNTICYHRDPPKKVPGNKSYLILVQYLYQI